MSNIAKVLVTICVIVTFFFIFAAISEARKDAGAQTPGVLGVILLLGVIGALKAVWKREKKGEDIEKDNHDNDSILQK